MIGIILHNFYQIALTTQFIAAGITFICLNFINAPYGKFSSTRWGPNIRSQSAWMLMEIPAVFTIAILAWFYRAGMGWSWIFLVIWEFHYIYRTFIFPIGMKHRSSNFPISMAAMAAIFNFNNGFINGIHLFAIRPIDTSWFSKPQFVMGTILFFTGFLIHFDSDRRILSQNPGSNKYIIPQGGFFRLVSCPNYLGEIIQWAGWAIMTWSLAGLAFAVFTFANVFPRGIAGHQWYKKKFADYPTNRKAIIPGIL